MVGIGKGGEGTRREEEGRGGGKEEKSECDDHEKKNLEFTLFFNVLYKTI